MTLTDILTLIVAAYGAGLASFLGYREWKKERKQLLIFLDYVEFYHFPQITIVNGGHRPITIVEVSFTMGKIKDTVPSNALLQEANPLPKILSDGESISLKLNGNLCDPILSKGKNLEVFIYDAEGRLYRNYQKRNYNPKFGFYSKLK